MNRLNWLPGPVWELWRDFTWAREKRREYLVRMQRYYDKGGISRERVIVRVRRLADGTSCLDWDDNIPEKWAKVLVRRWRLDERVTP